jgi:hypothetical protein
MWVDFEGARPSRGPASATYVLRLLVAAEEAAEGVALS